MIWALHKKSITRAQGRYLHASKYLAAGAWREAFEMPGKPSGVYTMQENVWQPQLRPGPRLQRSPDLADPLAGGEGTSFALPRILRSQPLGLPQTKIVTTALITLLQKCTSEMPIMC